MKPGLLCRPGIRTALILGVLGGPCGRIVYVFFVAGGYWSRAMKMRQSANTRISPFPISPASPQYRRNWPSMTWSATESPRSEEHTSELQSQSNLVCRLLLEKKKKKYK